MIADIKLKRLCQKQPLAGLLQHLQQTLTQDSLCVLDHQQEPVLGQFDTQAPRHPIMLDGEAIGWVSGSGQIAVVADLIAYAAQNERQSKALAQDTLAKYKELTLLYQLSEKVAACVEIPQLTALALEETRRMLTNGDLQIAIVLSDNDSQQLLIHDCIGELFSQGHSLQPVDGITASVLQSGSAEIVNDVSTDPRFAQHPAMLDTVHSLLCTALKSTDKIFGVILVVSERATVFQAADLKVLNVLASQIGMALGRAELITHLVEQELLQESLKLSRDIQMGMLSTNFPRFAPDCPVDVFAYMQPAKEVGGDFYDFFYLNPNTLLLTIGDVSGKGVPAALFMVMVKTLIRAIAKQESRPDKILEALNPELCRDNDSAMFVTLFLATLDISSGRLDFSYGGHNPPVILRRDGSVSYLQGPTGTALGILDGFSFKQQAIDLLPGDAIMLYTDGVTEAMSVDFELFNEDRLLDHLHACPDDDAEVLTRKVLAAVNDFTVDAEQSDDITLLTLRYADC